MNPPPLSGWLLKGLRKSVRARIIFRHRTLFHVVIQFVCHPPCQTKTTDETIYGAFRSNVVFGVDNPQHQSPLLLVQPLDELPVALLHFLLILCHGQRRVYPVVQPFQCVAHMPRLLVARHNSISRGK